MIFFDKLFLNILVLFISPGSKGQFPIVGQQPKPGDCVSLLLHSIPTCIIRNLIVIIYTNKKIYEKIVITFCKQKYNQKNSIDMKMRI